MSIDAIVRALAATLFAGLLATPAGALFPQEITVTPAQPTSNDGFLVGIDNYCCATPVRIDEQGVEVSPGVIRIEVDRSCGPLSAVGPYSHTVSVPPVPPGTYRIEYWTEGSCSDDGPEITSEVIVTAGPVTPPFADWIESAEIPGFRFQVRITAGDTVLEGSQELDCQEDTVCVSGAVPGRPEAFLRILGPRPNGFYWPTVVRFTPSGVEVWVEELATGIVRYYPLAPVPPGTDDLPGLQDRTGFPAQ